MVTNQDRVKISVALAKAIAYKNCGDEQKSQRWAARLVQLLDCAGILTPAAIAATADMEA